MTAEVAAPKLAYAAAVAGSDSNIAALAMEPAPSLQQQQGQQQQQREEDEAHQENPAENAPAVTTSSTAEHGDDSVASGDASDNGNVATPTPAETAEQLKRQKQQRGSSRRGGG
eukprot:CAMPEP_0113563918 /NCGR_PEP_ID=MMETSP0015_2-20120614/21327_1 /TAXON_ID=2838 /ORGANISM="Odontella" /LENGTH=113 /DNA_ID=CAMNT_0000465935 /DNA_START=340 /DNA_END=677 /DNA_ORIENTATION=- /assembly_acc=CAM_ASM_000160